MDKVAFLQRILAIQDSMFRLAKSLLKSTEESEDAVQEVLAKLWQNMNKIATYYSSELTC